MRRTMVASARADAKQLAIALEAASGIVSFKIVLNDTVISNERMEVGDHGRI